MENITFIGYSGRPYQFGIYPLSVTLPQEGGVYIFLYLDSHARRFVYCGRGENLDRESGRADRDFCISSNKPNCVAVLIEPSEDKRCVIEQDLLDNKEYKFACNHWMEDGCGF